MSGKQSKPKSASEGQPNAGAVEKSSRAVKPKSKCKSGNISGPIAPAAEGNGQSKSKPKGASSPAVAPPPPPSTPINAAPAPGGTQSKNGKSKTKSKSKSHSRTKGSKNSTKSNRKSRKAVSKPDKSNSRTQNCRPVKSSIISAKSGGHSLARSKKKSKSKSISKKAKKSESVKSTSKKRQAISVKSGSMKSPMATKAASHKSKVSERSNKSKREKRLRAIATACTMKVPSCAEGSNALYKIQGAKEVAKLSDIEKAGFKMGAEITNSDTDTFIKATYKGEEILCKKIDLMKCTPRKRENLLVTALRVERYMCGGDETGHPKSSHFIKLYDTFGIDGDSAIYTFMKYEPGKSLYCRLADGEAVSARSQRQWAVEMIQAVMKMHEVGVAHRNLTLHHILFDGFDRVKIAAWSKSVIFWEPYDGGKVLLQNPERRSRKNSYLPPECFRYLYNPSTVDIWSIGVLMVAMSTHRQPFNANSGFKFSAQWRQFVTIHPLNRLLRAACNKIFPINPKLRFSLEDLLKHEYFLAPLDLLDLKERKTTVDPKHNPKAFGGVEVSTRIGEDLIAQPDAEADNGKQENSKSVKKVKSSSKVRSTKSTSSRSSAKSTASKVPSEGNGDDDPGSEAASGNEGGSITESVPDSETAWESDAAESSAPEESASAAEPVSVSSNAMSDSSSKGSSGASSS